MNFTLKNNNLANLSIVSFFQGYDTTISLAFFRIAISLITLCHFLSYSTDFDLFLSQKALIPHDLSTLYIDEYLPTLPLITDFISSVLDTTSQNSLQIVLFLFILSCVALMVGFLTRFSALVCLFLHLAINNSNPIFIYGIDYFISMSLFYCMLFPTGKIHSLDNFIFKRKVSAIPIYYRRILQIHICIVYFFSGLSKSLGFNWWNGEAIWKTINLPYSNLSFNNHLNWLSSYPIILLILGISIFLIELLYPIFVFSHKTRKVWLFFVLGMHIFIAFSLNLFMFSAIMIAWNISAFHFNNPALQGEKPEPIPKLSYN